MATASQIYGMIGAAKAFNSSVSYSLRQERETIEAEIDELERSRDGTDDNKKNRKIRRLKKRLDFYNKARENVNRSSAELLTKVASYLDIGIEGIIKFLADTIVVTLPALESSVKLLLLSNIKNMVSCAVDPRIPKEWREEGVLINERYIDPRYILSSSPYSKWGKYNYFGVYRDKEQTEPRPVSELARAEDMNAFLWYAKNCGRFVSPNIIGDITEYFDVPSGTSLYDGKVFKGRDSHRFVEGSTFKVASDAATTFLCVNREFRQDGVYYTILPATDTWDGVNWYSSIMYDNPKPLFNISYKGGYLPDSPVQGGTFRFRILQEPYSTAGGFIVDLRNSLNKMTDMIGKDADEVVANEINNSMASSQYDYPGIQSPIPYKAKFNEDGVYNRNGRFTIDQRRYTIAGLDEVSGGTYYFNIVEDGSTIAYLRFVKKEKSFYIAPSDDKDGTADLTLLHRLLTECYGGLTVYEFNFDYVNSMRLFDEKSIAAGVVDALMNIDFGNPFRRGLPTETGSNGNVISDTGQIRIDAYVAGIVDKLIQEEDGEYKDCFYTFSNEEYEQMEMKAANDLKNGSLATDSGIGEIYRIIDAYKADASLEERVETLTLVFRKAANACGFSDGSEDPAGNGVPESVRYATESDEDKSVEGFISRALKYLTSAVVNALLTPKVIMLVQINRMLMGQRDLIPSSWDDVKDNFVPTEEELLYGISGVVKGCVREIIDTLQKQLLKLILERLSEITASYVRRLGTEYAIKWVLLLKQLLSCYKSNRSIVEGGGSGGQYAGTISSILDQVDYADIDQLVDEIIPNTNPC